MTPAYTQQLLAVANQIAQPCDFSCYPRACEFVKWCERAEENIVSWNFRGERDVIEFQYLNWKQKVGKSQKGLNEGLFSPAVWRPR